VDFFAIFQENAKKSPIYGLLAAKAVPLKRRAVCRVKNRLKAIFGIIMREAQQTVHPPDREVRAAAV
jgi:hypothetical protein